MIMQIFTDLKSALAYIDRHFHTENDVPLAISQAMFDPMGVNMAIITDRVLHHGYIPDGCEQKDGYRIYRYKKEPA